MPPDPPVPPPPPSHGANGHLNGAHADEADDEPSTPELPGNDEEPAFEPAPDAVADLAAACARFVHAKYRVPLDGTSDTLSLLDQYVRDARADIVVKPDTLDLLVASIGAYLGEVMRRAYGGTWFAVGDYDGWRLDMTRVFLTFNPLGMAREALALEEAEGWHAHLEMDDAYQEDVNRRLEALAPGGIDEDEFYAPSTRFDVVALAVDALRGKMIEDGHGDVTFSPDDYKRK